MGKGISVSMPEENLQVFSTWRDLDATTLSLKGPCPTIAPARIHDSHIMDLLMLHEEDPKELVKLNNIRLRLGLTLVSDMVTADGTRLEKSIWNRQPSDRKLHQSRRWPKTHRPQAADWKNWKHILSQALLVPNCNDRTLSQALGPWHEKDDVHWVWWYSPSQDKIWERTDVDS